MLRDSVAVYQRARALNQAEASEREAMTSGCLSITVLAYREPAANMSRRFGFMGRQNSIDRLIDIGRLDTCQAKPVGPPCKLAAWSVCLKTE